MEEIRYELKKSFEYAFKGEQREAGFITLAEPTVENIGFVSKLKQGFMRAISTMPESDRKKAIAEHGDAPQKDKEQDMSFDDMPGDALLTMLAMTEIDYQAYMQTAVATFCSGKVALVDGEEPLKKGLLDKMTVNDLEAMTGEYLKAFILTSVSEMMQA